MSERMSSFDEIRRSIKRESERERDREREREREKKRKREREKERERARERERESERERKRGRQTDRQSDAQSNCDTGILPKKKQQWVSTIAQLCPSMIAPSNLLHEHSRTCRYGVATISRLLKIIGFFGRILSLHRALLQKRPVILRNTRERVDMGETVCACLCKGRCCRYGCMPCSRHAYVDVDTHTLM